MAELKHIRIHQWLIDATYHGDKDLLFQAYANILDNAIKYTHESGEIKIAMKAEGQHYVIQIEDTGGGVAENELDKVFQRFYRSDVSRSSSGTGLGLSLVKAVFDLHHAEIVLRNTEKGLRFITKL